MTAWTTTVDSPVGLIQLVADEAGSLTHLLFEQERHPPTFDAELREDPVPFADATAQLAEYFAGSRREFDLPLAPNGTGFQRRVWQALRTIPYGETRSYAEQAAIVGSPRAVRAVGAANGRNPIAIIVPCHRVVGADGSLTGYGGGVERKSWLLAHEQSTVGAVLPLG